MLQIARLPAPSHIASNGPAWTVELCKARRIYYQELQKYDAGILKIKPENPRAIKARYGHFTVRIQLKKMFGRKCAYCESEVDSTSYTAVEHFRPQSIYPSLAYKWENFLQACERCNSHYKKDQFPIFIFNSKDRSKQSIANRSKPEVKRDDDQYVVINPTVDNPLTHFDLTFPVPKPLTYRGFKSLEVYGLDREDLEDQRRIHIQKIQHYIKTYNRASVKKDLITKRDCLALLKAEFQAKSEFAGTTRALISRSGILFPNRKRW